MLQFLTNRPRPVLGIDISYSAVRIFEISQDNHQWVVSYYGCEPLDPGVFYPDMQNECMIQDIDAVTQCIKKICDEHPATDKKAVLALPSVAVMHHTIYIPCGLRDGALEELVTLAASQATPYPMHAVNLDFELLGLCADNPAMQKVLVVVSPTAAVDNWIEPVLRAGLTVDAIEVDFLAMMRVTELLARPLMATGASTEVGNPFLHMAVRPGVDACRLNKEASDWLLACGLALRPYASN